MENNYRKLMERIPAPAGLEAQVLLAARRQEAEKPPFWWNALYACSQEKTTPLTQTEFLRSPLQTLRRQR